MLPLNVIEQLALKLRKRDSAQALYSLKAYSKAAGVALLNRGYVTELDIGAVRTNLLERTLPLPFDEVRFAPGDKAIHLGSHTVSAVDIPPAEQTTAYRYGTEWVILAKGDDGVDYIVAAEDQFLIPVGHVFYPLKDANVHYDSLTTFNNLAINQTTAFYTLETWGDVALVLNGIFNPSTNYFVTEHASEPAVQDGAEFFVNGDVKVNDAPNSDLRSPADVAREALFDAMDIKSVLSIELGELNPDNAAAAVEMIKRSILDTFGRDTVKEAGFDIDKLLALYGKDFTAIFESISGNVNAPKLRKAFKEHFTQKWGQIK